MDSMSVSQLIIFLIQENSQGIQHLIHSYKDSMVH